MYIVQNIFLYDMFNKFKTKLPFNEFQNHKNNKAFDFSRKATNSTSYYPDFCFDCFSGWYGFIFWTPYRLKEKYNPKNMKANHFTKLWVI